LNSTSKSVVSVVSDENSRSISDLAPEKRTS
jgi:hypothetical protein